MADNTLLNAGTGGDTVRDIDRTGVKTQIVALDLNPAGSETLMGGSMPVTAASLPLPSGAATSAKQDTGNTSIASVDTKVGEVQASPTANTVLDRLKTIATNVAALATTIVLGAGSAVIGVVNLALGGTALDGNSGVKSAQTLRVVLATDQPALTNKLLVTPDSVALPSHQSVNVDQLNGTTTDTNSGVKSAGTLRVVLATDQPALTNKLLVTPDLPSGAATAAKQPALGTAGTASSDVISVQGIASMTPLQVQGSVAHGSSSSGNPQYAGAEAIAHGTNPTAVSAGQRTKLYANRAGVPFVIGGHPNIVTLEAAYTAAQTDTAIITIATGLKIVVTQLMILASNANSVNAGARVGFGTASTPTTTGVVASHPGIAAGSGISRGDGSGILGVGADNEDLRITSDVPTSGSLRVLVSYYTIES